MALWLYWPRTTAAQRLMELKSRIQNLLMDKKVAKETKDAPIRVSKADVIRITPVSTSY